MNVHKFESYGTGNTIETRQYSYDETTIYEERNGVTHSAPITPEQVRQLNHMFFNDFIGPAYVFSDACKAAGISREPELEPALLDLLDAFINNVDMYPQAYPHVMTFEQFDSALDEYQYACDDLFFSPCTAEDVRECYEKYREQRLAEEVLNEKGAA